MEYLRIQLADEAPELGSGHRQVLVTQVGRDWVTLLEPGSCARCTVPREAGYDVKNKVRLHGYDTLARKATPIEYDPEAMVARIVKNARLYGRWDASCRDACVALGADFKSLPPLDAEAAAGGARLDPVATADPEAPEAKLPGEGVGHFVERQYMARREPARVVALAKENFPGCKVNLAHVKWYAGRLRKRLGPDAVPAWPASDFKEQD